MICRENEIASKKNETVKSRRGLMMLDFLPFELNICCGLYDSLRMYRKPENGATDTGIY